MYRIYVFLLFIGLITLPQLVFARPTKVVPILVNPENEVQIYFEPSSLTKIGSVLRFKLYMYYTPSVSGGIFEHPSVVYQFTEPVSSLTDTIEMSCKDQTYLSVKKQFYGIHDNILFEFVSPDNEPLSLVEINQVSGMMFNKLCNEKIVPRQQS